jgi:hypothetical protein
LPVSVEPVTPDRTADPVTCRAKPGTPSTSAEVVPRASDALETVTVGPPALRIACAPVAPNVVSARVPSSVETTVIAAVESATRLLVAIELGVAPDGAASDSVNVPAAAA